ncbi:hypothetical protein LWI29_004828 [Acer saccharum]|uniref:CRAL/TRIO N-terminal domain-containing protein n=1 Tax=Acer saccharum TaxID=4024 RepID=A0AA39SFT2_ACESA|nr:hypothetical protein LWI29_004828 [Acer saccharum]
MEGEVVLPLFAAAPFAVNKATTNSVAANGGGQSLPMFVGNKEVDDLMLRRFLRARNLDIEKGSNMFLKYLKWRRSFIPNGSISPSEIPNEIAQNKMFLQGFDKKGRPIGVVFGARHFQNKQNPEEFKRFAVYVLDKLSEKIPAGQEKFVVIADIQGWGYANSDLRAYIGALSILQVRSLLRCYVTVCRLKFGLISSQKLAGLLPGKTWKVAYPTCAIHIHDSMENCLPFHRQQY